MVFSAPYGVLWSNVVCTDGCNNVTIPALAYLINYLYSQRSGRGRSESTFFKVGEVFNKICPSHYANFWKKNLIWNFLWNVWNFGYYIKSCFLCNTQSFRHSTGRFRWDFFSKIGIMWGTYFVKKVPNFKKRWPTHDTPRPLTVQVVY